MYFFIHRDSSSIISQNICFSVPNVQLLCVLERLAAAANEVNLLVAQTPVKTIRFALGLQFCLRVGERINVGWRVGGGKPRVA